MYCTKCGKKNEKDTVFCNYCGKQIMEEEKFNYTVEKTAKNNPLAIAGFVVGLISNTFGMLTIGGIVAIILSAIALHKIKKYNEGGRGFAVVGLILGIVGATRIIFYILAIIFAIMK